MKPSLRTPMEADADPSILPWDRISSTSPISSHSFHRALIPRLDRSGVCHHLPDVRRLRIDINGCHAGSPLCVADALVEFAVGWAFFNRFFAASCEVGKITSSSHRVSIMVESGADLDRRRNESIGWIDETEQVFRSPWIEELRSARAPRAVPVFDELDALSVCERVFRGFDADGAGLGYVHAALATQDETVCIARDVTVEAAAAKILGWALRDGGELGSSMLIARGIIDAALIGAASRAGVVVVATDAVPTRSAVELAGETCTTILGLALSHRRALFADGGHIGIC